MSAPILVMSGISKRFMSVEALRDVDFECRAGEVHAICGENGAGKSTLMKVLGGVYPPDSGSIWIGGRHLSFRHPVEARRQGISIIHQEFSLLPDRTVAENLLLGLEPAGRFGRLDRTKMRARAEELLRRVGIGISPDRLAGSLTVAQRQMVEIAKSLAVDVKILVLDEPTAALEDDDARALLALVRRLRQESVALVYISHRLNEVFAVADRVTVLKDGRKVETLDAGAATPRNIIRMMVGRELSDFFPPRPEEVRGQPVLTISDAGNDRLDGINLTVRQGEIVGIAGLEGSGKSDLVRAIFGDRPLTRGRMTVAGRDARPRNVVEAMRAGLGYLSDDRQAEGLLRGQSIRDNAALSLRTLPGLAAAPGRGPTSDAAIDARLMALDVRAASFKDKVALLSGGNQQKTLLSRLLGLDPMVLLVNEPTRGIDVAAKAQVYRMMRDCVARGRGLLMASSELPEIIGVSDRIVVMRAFRIVAELPGGASEEEVVAHAIGHRHETRTTAVAS